MKVLITLATLLLMVTLTGCGQVEKHETPGRPKTQDTAGDELKGIRSRLTNLLNHAIDSTRFPRSLEHDGSIRGVPSKDWTSGFYVGNLLFAHQLTGEVKYLEYAEKWLPFLEKEKFNDRTHDMGFKINCSYGNALEITAKEKYKEVIIASADVLVTRYNPKIGCIKSWDFGKDRWTFPVIIDNMMNLELLLKATILSGDSSYYKIAVSHAQKTLENHFREDMSSYHVVDYDPKTGQVINKLTHQGYSDGSAWARGQAWGLYGFTMAYRFTGEGEFLKQAEKIATFILGHPNLPGDMVPYWDFDAPGIPDEVRDASSAAIIASALLELTEHLGKEKYLETSKTIISNLMSWKYLIDPSANVPFLLKHSTGNMNRNDEVNVPINYADYYFLESLLRLNKKI